MPTDPYTGTTIGLDGVRRATDSPDLPTEIPVDSRKQVRVLPTAVTTSQAAAATHLVPCTSLEVVLNLNNANDNPAVTFANPGPNRYAQFNLKLLNADDSSTPTIGVPAYLTSSPAKASNKVTAPASTDGAIYDVVVIGQDHAIGDDVDVPAHVLMTLRDDPDTAALKIRVAAAEAAATAAATAATTLTGRVTAAEAATTALAARVTALEV